MAKPKLHFSPFSQPLRRGLHSSRTVAAIFAAVVAGIGIYVVGASLAASPGSIQVTTYRVDGNNRTRINGVTLHVKAYGNYQTSDTSRNCNPYKGTTSNGQVHFPNCWTAQGGTKAYQLSYMDPPSGFKFRSIHGAVSDTNDRDARFDVRAGRETAIEVWFDPPAAASPPPPPPPPPPPSSPSNKPPGAIQVTSYAYNNGTLTRVGNTVVHVKSYTHQTTDTTHNCNPYNKTTNGAAGSNYAQATFPNCWVGTERTHDYMVSYINPPAGYTVRSVHADAGTFARSDSGSQYAGDSFVVVSGQTVNISVWLDPPKQAGGTSSGTSSGSGSGGRSTGTATGSGGSKSSGSASTGSGGSQAGAGSRSGSVSDSQGDGISLDEGADDISDIGDIEDIDISDADLGFDSAPEEPSAAPANPATPPDTPKGLSAVEIDNGIISLSWSQTERTSAYELERSLDGAKWEILSDSLSATTYVDATVSFGKTYFYRLSAANNHAETSDYTRTQITTSAFTPNVSADDTEDFSLSIPEDDAELTIAADSFDEDVDCSLVATSGDDLGSEIPDDNEVVGNAYQAVCKNASGEIVDDFDADMDFSLGLDDESGTELYDLSNGDTISSQMDTATSEPGSSKKHILKAKLGSSGTFALIRARKTAGPAVPLLTLISLLALAGCAFLFIRARLVMLIPSVHSASNQQPRALSSYLPNRPPPDQKKP